MYSVLLWKHRDLHPSLLSNLHIQCRPRKLQTLDWSTSELVNCDATTWLSHCELPLDYSTSWLPAPHLQQHYTLAPRRTQRPTQLACATQRTPIFCENSGVHTSLLSNLHIAPCLPRKLPPLIDWATSWVSYAMASYLLISLFYNLTQLVKCELPLDYSTTWLSHSIVSYLLVSPPLDWASQVWATSWLLYHLIEPFKCELPLDYSTTWLSHSIVSYLLATLPLDRAIPLLVTTEVSNWTSFENVLIYQASTLAPPWLPKSLLSFAGAQSH